MDAPSLLMFFDAVYLIAMAAWVGSILFFSFGVAPIIFRVLPADSAARFVRTLFPRYYAWGATSGALALASFTCGVLSHPEYRGARALIQIVLLLAGTLIMLYCGNALTPAINAARDAGAEQTGRFDRLHRRSVRLNSLVLLAGLGLLVAFVARPEPETTGIVETTPGQRAEPSVSSPAPEAAKIFDPKAQSLQPDHRGTHPEPADPTP
ncbi:hypothetical protein BH23PLA1_BH23PLA1_15910 [soil metagenome]